MKIARSAGARTGGKFTGYLRLAGCRERRHFLMSHMYPFDGAPASQSLSKAIQAVTHNSKNSLDTGLLQGCHDKIRYLVDRHLEFSEVCWLFLLMARACLRLLNATKVCWD
jgi:hypothetical protein